jgi:succinate dehydrogenase/fumarate reductase flavoprotein subunit
MDTSYPNIIEDYYKSGRGPIYMACAGLSDEDYQYMLNFLRHEGNGALVDYMAEDGLDPRKTPVEFMHYEMKSLGGVYYNENGETSLPGLYAADDEIFGGISNAAIFGWISGENAANYSKTQELCDLKKQNQKINGANDLANQLRNRETGGDWKEFNLALQETMDDYCGYIRSSTFLEAGLKHLQRIKQKGIPR